MTRDPEIDSLAMRFGTHEFSASAATAAGTSSSATSSSGQLLDDDDDVDDERLEMLFEEPTQSSLRRE